MRLSWSSYDVYCAFHLNAITILEARRKSTLQPFPSQEIPTPDGKRGGFPDSIKLLNEA
jgi:hypothetical protein